MCCSYFVLMSISSPGYSKAFGGGKENLHGDRTSGAVEESISKYSVYNMFSNVCSERAPDYGIRLGSINEREILDWINIWDEVVAEHPTHPFVFANSLSLNVKCRIIRVNKIRGGEKELNGASLSQLVKWLSVCLRPADNISFIEALENNVFFRGKRDFVLTEN